jgi:hypothetical protein
MKEKIQAAIKDMESKIERDSKHIYHDKFSGFMLQGVTSVSSIVPKDWLSAWGAKECAKDLGYTEYEDYTLAQAVLDAARGMSVKQWVNRLKEAKGAAGRKSKKALVDGKLGHKWLEDNIDAQLKGTGAVGIPTGLLERPIKQFCEWEAYNVQEWYASEALVCNPAKMYAGQLDAICLLKDGKIALCDFKFASHVSEDYSLQTAGYAACFESYGITFDNRLIIRLPKTLEQEEWNPVTFERKMVPNNIQVHEIKTPYERDRDAFYAALIVKSWINMATIK